MLIKTNKGIKGTSKQSLINDDVDEKGRAMHGFRICEVEELYNTNEEFKQKFDALYDEYKNNLILLGIDSDIDLEAADLGEDEDAEGSLVSKMAMPIIDLTIPEEDKDIGGVIL